MREELKNAFRRPHVYIGTAGFLLCLLGTSLPMWITRCIDGDRQYMSAMGQSFTPLFFGGAILIIPFCAALAYAILQVEEIRTGFLLPRAMRGTLKQYALTKLTAAALCGAVALGGACLLHSLLWHVLAGPYDIAVRPDVEVLFIPGTVYDTLARLPYAWPAYLHAAVGLAITGALWSVIALAVAPWMPDTQLVVVLPVVLYYVWKSGFSFLLFQKGWMLPDFTGLYNNDIFWKDYWIALGFHLLLLVGAGGLYFAGIKRRLCRG